MELPKFLLDKEGRIVDRFASSTKPKSLKKNIEKLLNSIKE